MSTDQTTKAADSQSPVDTATERAGDLATTAQDKASDVVADAGEHARDLLAESRQSVRNQAESQAEQLAGTARELASELRSMGRSSDTRLAGLLQEGGDRLADLVDRFDAGGLDAVAGDAKRFARNRPMVFLASTFAAGFAAGRVIRHADTDEIKSAATDQVDDAPQISDPTVGDRPATTPPVHRQPAPPTHSGAPIR